MPVMCKWTKIFEEPFLMLLVVLVLRYFGTGFAIREICEIITQRYQGPIQESP